MQSLWALLRAVALGLGILDLVTDVLELLILHVSISFYLDLLQLRKWSRARHTLEGDLLTLESPDYRLGALLEEEDGFALGLQNLFIQIEMILTWEMKGCSISFLLHS